MFGFNPLSTGHAPEATVKHVVREIGFQSPIYGSRTKSKKEEKAQVLSFNPLSTGHAPSIAPAASPALPCFNPLSTGHARNFNILLRTCITSFNPLSTGHAHPRASKPYKSFCVSIPYLRVTHLTTLQPFSPGFLFQSPIYGSRTLRSCQDSSLRFLVSIPYLRVTHLLPDFGMEAS